MKKLLVVVIPEDVLDDFHAILKEHQMNASITIEILMRDYVRREQRAKKKTT